MIMVIVGYDKIIISDREARHLIPNGIPLMLSLELNVLPRNAWTVLRVGIFVTSRSNNRLGLILSGLRGSGGVDRSFQMQWGMSHPTTSD
jgi:hypothetical protein